MIVSRSSGWLSRHGKPLLRSYECHSASLSSACGAPISQPLVRPRHHYTYTIQAEQGRVSRRGRRSANRHDYNYPFVYATRAWCFLLFSSISFYCLSVLLLPLGRRLIDFFSFLRSSPLINVSSSTFLAQRLIISSVLLRLIHRLFRTLPLFALLSFAPLANPRFIYVRFHKLPTFEWDQRCAYFGTRRFEVWVKNKMRKRSKPVL